MGSVLVIILKSGPWSRSKYLKEFPKDYPSQEKPNERFSFSGIVLNRKLSSDRIVEEIYVGRLSWFQTLLCQKFTQSEALNDD